MHRLHFNEEERKALSSRNGFFDILTRGESRVIVPLWQKILSSSEAPEELKARILEVLPEGAIIGGDKYALKGYSPLSAVQEVYFGESRELNGMNIKDWVRSSPLKKTDEPNARIVAVGIADILDVLAWLPQYAHVGVYLGSHEGCSFVFHKPQDSIPQISTLERISSAYKTKSKLEKDIVHFFA